MLKIKLLNLLKQELFRFCLIKNANFLKKHINAMKNIHNTNNKIRFKLMQKSIQALCPEK